ncbi:hypothetical protein [Roseimaritima sediminicola]|uniref:hypothetical protein n=1 Tax=Roseimaritima sediminicola TaxID=2662066 RepID=UPI0012984B9B|nr:hypothetical protein [Roseimaritima sediminicola]
MRTIMLTAALVACCSAGMVRAQDQGAQEASRLESQPEKRTPADQIDFNVALQVPLKTLDTLGQTIEQARLTADPVALAAAARVLAAAEAVAGDKTAELKSDQLWQEAQQLAKRRNESAELAALAELAPDGVAADLQEASEAAKTAEEEARVAAEAGEKSRDIHGVLHIINRSHEYIHLQVDGRCIGSIAPHGQRRVHVHGAFHLTGHSRYHHWHEDAYGHHHHYDWVLHDPHH